MRLRKCVRLFGMAVPAVCLVSFLPPAALAADAGTGSFELYGGYYFPDGDVPDDDLTYGVRGGYRFTDALAFEATVGRFEQEVGRAGPDFELTLVDLSAAWTLNPGSQKEFALFAGPGWAWLDASARGFGLVASDVSLTVHAGASLEVGLSEGIYLRPDVRARYFEKGQNVDLEASLAIGFRLGG